LLLTDGSALAGAALLRPVLPFVPERTPRLSGKPILIASGRRDPYASVESVEALAATLRSGGAEVEVAWSDAGHGLEPSELARVAAWFEGQAH
jgi:predicted esterase